MKKEAKLVINLSKIILLTLSLIIFSTIVLGYKYPAYTPLHSFKDVSNETLSKCSPPETAQGCSTCNLEYKEDCVYYFAKKVSDCDLIYEDSYERETCYMFVFRENVKLGSEIPSVCGMMREEYRKNSCIVDLAPYYSDELKTCDFISSSDESGLNYLETCYEDFAKEKKDPTLGCSRIQSLVREANCCLRAKYNLQEQFITSRQDIIDKFKEKYGEELKDCNKIVGIKGTEVVGSCEDLNCECLSPCNALKDDPTKQQKCAMDCSKKYNTCYDKAKYFMPQVENDRYNQQSFYGSFSRKHCSEYQGLAAKLKDDNHTKKIEPAECTSHNECDEKRLCNACGKCVDQKDVFDTADINVSFDVTPENEEITLNNDFTEQGVFRVNVKPLFTNSKTGKRIDFCEMTYPGIKRDIKLVAINSMPEELNFAGFTTGQLNDPRDLSARCSIDLKETEKKCAFIVSPNDKRKPVGFVKDVTQYFDLGLMDVTGASSSAAISNQGKVLNMEKAALKLNLLASEYPKIEFKMNSYQMQQGTSRSIKFKVDDKNSKLLMINVKVIGPATIFEEGKNEVDIKSLHFTAKPNEELQIGIKAPEMGNFDIGQELSSLSMVDLQKEAGKQILTDAAFATVDTGLEKLSDNLKAASEQEKLALELYQGYLTKHPDFRTADRTARFVMNAKRSAEFERDIKAMTDTYKLGKGVINDLPGLKSGIQGSQEDVSVNVDQTIGQDGATTTEKIANLGVTGINLAQLGVSVLTFVPNKLPGVGQLTSGFQVAFSSATNIWKANLKYIAKDEKIGRAQELFVPVMVVVTAEDLSGWQSQSAIVMQIAYHQV